MTQKNTQLVSNHSKARVRVLTPQAARVQPRDPLSFLNDNLEDVMAPGLVGLRGTMYATRTFELPLSALDIEQNFGQEINYFSMQVSSARVTEQPNNLISTSTVRTPFLVRAIAFVAFAEFEQAAIAGGRFNAPTVANTNVPSFTGAIPFGAEETRRPATFNFGWPVLEFLWGMMSAYRFQMFLGGDLRYVDELLRHIGTIEQTTTRYCGYGQAQRRMADRIRAANDRYADLGLDERFLPITSQQTADDPDVFEGVLPPLAMTSLGGPCSEGIYGSCFPIKPFVAMPGVPIDMQLVRENNEFVFYDAMVEALGVPTSITYDANWSDVLAGGAGYASDFKFNYGRAQIGFILLGARLTARCCVDWYYNYGSLLSGIYERNEVTVRALTRMSRDAGFDGMVQPRNLAGSQRPLLSGVSGPGNSDADKREFVSILNGLPLKGKTDQDKADEFYAMMQAQQAKYRKDVIAGQSGLDFG